MLAHIILTTIYIVAPDITDLMVECINNLDKSVIESTHKCYEEQTDQRCTVPKTYGECVAPQLSYKSILIKKSMLGTVVESAFCEWWEKDTEHTLVRGNNNIIYVLDGRDDVVSGDLVKIYVKKMSNAYIATNDQFPFLRLNDDYMCIHVGSGDYYLTKTDKHLRFDPAPYYESMRDFDNGLTSAQESIFADEIRNAVIGRFVRWSGKVVDVYKDGSKYRVEVALGDNDNECGIMKVPEFNAYRISQVNFVVSEKIAIRANRDDRIYFRGKIIKESESVSGCNFWRIELKVYKIIFER